MRSSRAENGVDATATLRELGASPLKDLPEPERLFQLVIDRSARAASRRRMFTRRRSAAAGLPDYSLPPADVPCPYKGLVAFEPEDSELFFGREELVSSLVSRLEESAFLAVVGPSGSGKSSLVRAGVVPQLDVARNEFASRSSSRASTRSRRSSPCRAPISIVVDQFEEIFTLCRDEEERFAFVDGLLDAAEQRSRVVVVLRADFYGHCAAHPRLAAALENRQALIGPMTEEELRQAIERPGRAGRARSRAGAGGQHRPRHRRRARRPAAALAQPAGDLEAAQRSDAHDPRLSAVGRRPRGDREDRRDRVPGVAHARAEDAGAQHLPAADRARRGDRGHSPPGPRRRADTSTRAGGRRRRGAARARRRSSRDRR